MKILWGLWGEILGRRSLDRGMCTHRANGALRERSNCPTFRCKICYISINTLNIFTIVQCLTKYVSCRIWEEMFIFRSATWCFIEIVMAVPLRPICANCVRYLRWSAIFLIKLGNLHKSKIYKYYGEKQNIGLKKVCGIS